MVGLCLNMHKQDPAQLVAIATYEQIQIFPGLQWDTSTNPLRDFIAKIFWTPKWVNFLLKIQRSMDRGGVFLFGVPIIPLLVFVVNGWNINLKISH